jgi:hypothetical protein
MTMNRVMIALTMGLLVVVGSAGVAGSRKPTIPYHDPSTMQEYNPNAEWRKEPCKHCDGKGFKVETREDFKRNRTARRLVTCPYCKGKGYVGMSRK